MDELAAILFKVDIEKLVSDQFNFVRESFLRFLCRLSG